MIEVYFDGVIWMARKVGCPGRVFADTEAEALYRARGWSWNHLRIGKPSRP